MRNRRCGTAPSVGATAGTGACHGAAVPPRRGANAAGVPARPASAAGLALLLLAVLAGCASDPPALAVTAPALAVTAPPPPHTVTALAEPAACGGGFAAIDLDHRIQWLGGRITNFDTIGSGLAVGDLDNDGDLDLVLANLARPSTVYWNDGEMQFRSEPLATGAARAVNAIDFDGDGWLDLAFTHPGAPPSLWLSLGAAGPDAAAYDRFQRVARLGAGYVANAMGWADLDGDGDLDVVVSNMREPSQVFENRLCSGANLLVDLRQPGTGNTHAIGAQVRLVGELDGAPLHLSREVRSQSGYLSGDASRLHFGVPSGATLTRLEIVWPDGTRSHIPEPAPGTLIAATHPTPR